MARTKLRCIVGCPGLKSSYREKGLFPLYLDGKIQNLISRKSFLPFQKQPFADASQSGCSKKLCKIHRKTPALECLFNKVLVLQTYIHVLKLITCYTRKTLEKGLRHLTSCL